MPNEFKERFKDLSDSDDSDANRRPDRNVLVEVNSSLEESEIEFKPPPIFV